MLNKDFQITYDQKKKTYGTNPRTPAFIHLLTTITLLPQSMFAVDAALVFLSNNDALYESLCSLRKN